MGNISKMVKAETDMSFNDDQLIGTDSRDGVTEHDQSSDNDKSSTASNTVLTVYPPKQSLTYEDYIHTHIPELREPSTYTESVPIAASTSSYRGITSRSRSFETLIQPGARNSFANTPGSSKDLLANTFTKSLSDTLRHCSSSSSLRSSSTLSSSRQSGNPSGLTQSGNPSDSTQSSNLFSSTQSGNPSGSNQSGNPSGSSQSENIVNLDHSRLLSKSRRSRKRHSRKMSGNSNINNGGPQRQAPSPVSGQHANTNAGTNGAGGAMNGINVAMPMGAGQQMDVNLVFQKLVELSEVLKDNREKTAGIIAGAEELATRAAASGANPSLQEANNEIYTARIASLTQELHNEQKKVRILMREQRENTKLIGEYETAVGDIVEMVRNHTYNTSLEKHGMARRYNNSLQEERDDHFNTRMERDQYMALYNKVVGQLRTAYNLRCQEEDVPTSIIMELQTEVRILRDLLGWEPQEFKDEAGYQFLKDVPDAGPGNGPYAC